MIVTDSTAFRLKVTHSIDSILNNDVMSRNIEKSIYLNIINLNLIF